MLWVLPSKGVSGGPVITPLNLVRSDWSMISTLIAHCWACMEPISVMASKTPLESMHHTVLVAGSFQNQAGVLYCCNVTMSAILFNSAVLK